MGSGVNFSYSLKYRRCKLGVIFSLSSKEVLYEYLGSFLHSLTILLNICYYYIKSYNKTNSLYFHHTIHTIHTIHIIHTIHTIHKLYINHRGKISPKCLCTSLDTFSSNKCPSLFE